MDPEMRPVVSRAMMAGAGVLLGGLMWIIGYANREPNVFGVIEEPWPLVIGRFIVIVSVVVLVISLIQAARLVGGRNLAGPDDSGE